MLGHSTIMSFIKHCKVQDKNILTNQVLKTFSRKSNVDRTIKGSIKSDEGRTGQYIKCTRPGQ